MSEKIREYVLLFGFLFLIVTPIIDQQFDISSKYFQSTENRKLKSKPKFDIKKISKFVKEFDGYYTDNFGLRNLYFKLFSNYKFKLLGVSPLNEKAIIGKDGWLFLGNSYGQVIEETLGNQIFTLKELETIAKNIKTNRDDLQKKNISYYLAVAPNKHTIYNNRLPKYLNKKPNTNKLDQLKAYLKEEIDFDIIDYREALSPHKETKRLYHKVNSHWNGYGAFFAYEFFIDALKIDHNNLEAKSLADYSIDTTFNKTEELTNLLGINVEEEVFKFRRNFKSKSKRLKSKIAIPDYYKRNPKIFETRFECKDTTNKLKVLLFADSFSNAMKPFIKESFKESLFIVLTPMDRNIIDSESPDIVITEIVERNLDHLLRQNY